MRSFQIMPGVPQLQLDTTRQGTMAFSVSNALGKPVRARFRLVAEGPTKPQWLSLVGEQEHLFAADETYQLMGKVVVPPGEQPGAYPLHLLVASVENPDEDYTSGPTVSVQAPAVLDPAPDASGWRWIPAAALGVALLIGGIFGVRWLLNRQTPARGPAPEAPARLDFNGLDTCVRLGNPPGLDITSRITVEAWVKPLATDGLRNIVARGHQQNPAGEFYLRINSGLYQTGAWNGTDHATGVRIPPEDVGRWVHLASVHDGTHWRLYRDGKEVASSPDSLGAVPVAEGWAIGARSTGTERFFQGQVRDVRIWRVARTPEQVQADMNGTLTGREEGLAGSWPLDEGKGFTARDLTGANAGTVSNPTWLPGGAPLAPTFNGSSSYVDLGNPPALDFTFEITLEAWIRPLASGGLQNILAHGYRDNPNAEVYLRVNDGQYQVGSWNGAPHGASRLIPEGDLGRWIHLAGVYDGSRWVLYRNGTEISSVADNTGALRVAEKWAIGARGTGSERFFRGSIRDARIWSVARTEAQLREGARTPPDASAAGLEGRWPLDEGKGEVLKDLSTNQLNGTAHQLLW